MSFTTEVKNEICSFSFDNLDKMTELCGFVRNNYSKNGDKIILMTENPKVARRVFTLFKDIYDINLKVEQRKGVNFSNKKFYFIEVSSKVDVIFDDLCLNSDSVKDYLIGERELKVAYLRGSFLACGSINDPKTARYHLEYLTEKYKEALIISNLLTFFDINNKIINRDYGYMIYVKEAEKIADFLRLINASRAVLYYEDIRIYRDHKNMTNRLNNCEQANVEKVIKSSNSQIDDIKKIIDIIGLDAVPLKLKDVMEYRLKYPDTSLSELSLIMSKETTNNITKSGLNHRLRKIKELREKLEGFKKNTN